MVSSTVAPIRAYGYSSRIRTARFPEPKLVPRCTHGVHMLAMRADAAECGWLLLSAAVNFYPDVFFSVSPRCFPIVDESCLSIRLVSCFVCVSFFFQASLRFVSLISLFYFVFSGFFHYFVVVWRVWFWVCFGLI